VTLQELEVESFRCENPRLKEFVKMPKRLFAGVVGILSLCACYIASAYAIEALDDFKYSGIEWWAVLGELTMCLMAITSLSIGVRFLRFAWDGRPTRRRRFAATIAPWNGIILSGVCFYTAVDDVCGFSFFTCG
jgi:hypothetical protein